MRLSNLTSRRALFLIIALLLCAMSRQASAAPPWNHFVTFKRIEAVKGKAYPLTRDHGPWLIMATTFRGPDAEADANNLVYELRKDHKLNAYTMPKKFDYSESFESRGFDKFGKPRRARHANNMQVNEVAVVIGDYAAIDDPKAQKTLKRIKTLQPQSLNPNGKKPSSQSFSSLRQLHNKIWNKEKPKQPRGQMRMAFMAANPMVPKSYFKPKGVDKFVKEMNDGVKHSLLACPGAYTVRVATFKGNSMINGLGGNQKSKKDKPSTGRLARAGDQAHAMVEQLRRSGVEAYEFHDRDKSIVTVGSFNATGAKRSANGHLVYNPGVQAIINRYAAIRRGGGVQPASAVNPSQRARRASGAIQLKAGEIYDAGFDPRSNIMSTRYRTLATEVSFESKGRMKKSLQCVPFDVEPTPIEVPRRSVSRDYAGFAR